MRPKPIEMRKENCFDLAPGIVLCGMRLSGWASGWCISCSFIVAHDSTHKKIINCNYFWHKYVIMLAGCRVSRASTCVAYGIGWRGRRSYALLLVFFFSIFVPALMLVRCCPINKVLYVVGTVSMAILIRRPTLDSRNNKFFQFFFFHCCSCCCDS